MRIVREMKLSYRKEFMDDAKSEGEIPQIFGMIHVLLYTAVFFVSGNGVAGGRDGVGRINKQDGGRLWKRKE